MEPNFKHLLASLLNDRFDQNAPRIPDGITDLSSIVLPLVEVMRHGRPFNSNHEYHAAEFVARVTKAYVGDEPTNESLAKAVLGFGLLLTLALRSACAMHPDMTPEEILMDAADVDVIRQLGAEAAAIECYEGPDGSMIPNLASLSVFAKATPIPMAAIHGFIRRKLTPFIKYFFEDHSDETPNATDSTDGCSISRFEIIDEDAMQDPTADALEGFDEMLDRFNETDLRRYEMGDDIEEILSEDPREPDDE